MASAIVPCAEPSAQHLLMQSFWGSNPLPLKFPPFRKSGLIYRSIIHPKLILLGVQKSFRLDSFCNKLKDLLATVTASEFVANQRTERVHFNADK